MLSPVGQSETKKWYLTAASAQDCSGFVNIIAKLKTDIQRKEADGKARPKHKLHVAVKRCDLDAVKECLRGGNQDVNVQDHKGRYGRKFSKCCICSVWALCKYED